MKTWSMPEVMELEVSLTADGNVYAYAEGIEVGCLLEDGTFGSVEDSNCKNTLKKCES